LSAESFTRRAFVGFSVASLALGALGPLGERAEARGRLPTGGKVSLRIPFSIQTIDPHRLDDPLAALLADALFDTLYVRDGAAIVPSLAEGEPVLEAEGLVVKLRRGLLTAGERPIDARDAVFALGRARRFGGRNWFGELGTIDRVGNEAIRFSLRDPARLMQILASPLASILPIAFEAERPDGTGPFQASRRDDALSLVRNPRAARGPAFLDEIVVRSGADLAASLRSFEAGTDDIGWLGAGLHSPRKGSKPFDAGSVAWLVVRAGRDAAPWDAPGVIQRLLDGLSPSKLAYLGLGPAWKPERDDGWGGPPGEILVRDDAPYLVEVARTLAALLSRPGHDLVAKPISARDVANRRTKRDYALLLDVIRPVGATALAAWVALGSSDEAAGPNDAAGKTSRVAETATARTLARTMRLGVLGELHVQGARIAELVLPSGDAGWDLGSAYRARRVA
jgi:peptide/nickel transport system substrate-binding protein